MKSRETIINAGLALALFGAALTSGCASSDGKEGKVIPTSVKPAAGATPTPGPILLIYRSSAPEDQLDEFDAKVALEQGLKPSFLTAENLGGSLQLELIPNSEDLSRVGNRFKRWQVVNNHGSKLEAVIEAAYGTGGLQTAKVTGQVKGVFSSEQPFVYVKTGEANKVVSEIEEKGVFNLGGGNITVIEFPGRSLPGSDETVELIMAIRRVGKTMDGRSTELTVSPNGKFEYSILPK